MRLAVWENLIYLNIWYKKKQWHHSIQTQPPTNSDVYTHTHTHFVYKPQTLNPAKVSEPKRPMNTTMKYYTSNYKHKLHLNSQSFVLINTDSMLCYFISLWHHESRAQRVEKGSQGCCVIVCTDILLAGRAGRSLWWDQSWSQWRNRGDFPSAAPHITTKAFNKIRATRGAPPSLSF